VYVDSKQKKVLQQGSPVRISDPNRPNDLLRRTLITKSGRVYRHLSQEEEDRVLALERKRDEDEQKYGELGAKEMMKLDDDDLLNIQGGLDELLKHGDRHGISWVVNDNENADFDEEDDADYSIANDEPGDLAALADDWRAVDSLGSMPAAAGSKEHSAARPPRQTKGLNLRAMDLEKLQRIIKESQMEIEQARKEMEAAERKWGKNRKEAAKWREAMLKGKVTVGAD
jgi:leucyl aminopeptidase (aminopeptidase T)